MKTSFGIPNLSRFQYYGKFTCTEPGYYFITTTIESIDNQLYIDIVLNQAYERSQYITGDTDSHWESGSTSVSLYLQTNDQVWIKLHGRKRISHACLTIFKIK